VFAGFPRRRWTVASAQQKTPPDFHPAALKFYRACEAAVGLAAAVTAATTTSTAAEATAGRTSTCASAACARTTTRTTRTACATRAAAHNCGLAGEEAFALQLLACKLAGATDGFRLLACLLLRRLLEIIPEFHLTENTLALHLLFERLEGLVDVVVANEYLQR
jgi:hypothetical protein